MKVTIAAIGAMKASPEKELVSKYLKQLPWQVSIAELEVKKPLPTEQRKIAEAELLLSATADCHQRIALDERGKALGSGSFAERIANWQQEGYSHIGVIIGGQDGLDASVRQQADLTLSFGALTWPHMLARAMLMEQLYRAHTILSGHPYHRA